MKPNLALVYQNVRIPFVFEEALAAGVDLTLIHAPGATLPRDLPAVTRTVPLDIYGDANGSIDALADLHRRGDIAGLLTLYEPAVPFTARAAAALGVPGLAVEAALAARDKSAARERFRAAGMNTPGFVKIDAKDDVARAAALRFPVVVKPTSGYSSEGVIRCDSADQLEAAIAKVGEINRDKFDTQSRAADRVFSGVLVEEFIDGPEYAVESFVRRGRVHVLSIGYKGNPKGPYFEEGIYLAPAPLSDRVQARVVDEVRRAAIALGITEGPTHTELRIQNDVPYILEVGARFGGSGISHFIVARSTGVPFLRLAIDNALGGADCSRVPESPAPVRTAGNYIMPIHGHGTVKAIRGLDEVRKLPEVERVIQFIHPGDVIQAYPRFSGYPAFVLTTHKDYASGAAFYRMLDERLRVEYEQP